MGSRRRAAAAKAKSPVSAGARFVAFEVAGLFLVGLALLGGLAVASYAPADPAFRIGPVANAAGPAGATLAALLVGTLGSGAFVVVVASLVVGGGMLRRGALPALGARFWVGALLLLVGLASLPAILARLAPGQLAVGRSGLAGEAVAGALVGLLHAWGALVVAGLGLLVGALCLVGIPPGRALAAVAAAAGRVGAWALAGLAAAGAGLSALAARVGEQLGRLARGFAVLRERRARRARVAAIREPEPEAPVRQAPGPAAAASPKRGRGVAPDIVDHRAAEAVKPEQEEFAFTDQPGGGPFTLPDVSLFQRPPGEVRAYDRDSLIMNSRILEKKLQDFGVLGRVLNIHPGPVITMYEFEPAPGIKVNRITSLSDDLALALRALSIRIIAPIPGKSVVGIEVPNPDRETVYIRDLLDARSFRRSGSVLNLALGKDIFGSPVEADLAKMPHLLVAGATGTGKSVFLNSLLCSILCRATPDDVKLLLIDPKLLELSIYEGIPHLIADVVTNPKRAAAALQGVVHKMEERYQMMAALGVRNILQFNARVDEELAAGNKSFRLKPKPGQEEGEECLYQRLPYIVVVIDELADLMVVSARDVEESLQRIAQMARASGIHLVLATQRPSVDVLTGIIKANFPSRISFQVSSRTDSRTILDGGGAEHLLGQGDMLFVAPGTSKLQRLHGPFVTEGEVTQLVEFLRKQGSPQFDDTLLKMKEESEAREERGDDVDEFYDKAIEIVAETRNASISYIQRRLKVGYNRAARMIEQMEIDGIIGPQEGTKGREVFARPIGADMEVE